MPFYFNNTCQTEWAAQISGESTSWKLSENLMFKSCSTTYYILYYWMKLSQVHFLSLEFNFLCFALKLTTGRPLPATCWDSRNCYSSHRTLNTTKEIQRVFIFCGQCRLKSPKKCREVFYTSTGPNPWPEYFVSADLHQLICIASSILVKLMSLPNVI